MIGNCNSCGGVVVGVNPGKLCCMTCGEIQKEEDTTTQLPDERIHVVVEVRKPGKGTARSALCIPKHQWENMTPAALKARITAHAANAAYHATDSFMDQVARQLDLKLGA